MNLAFQGVFEVTASGVFENYFLYTLGNSMGILRTDLKKKRFSKTYDTWTTNFKIVMNM